MNNKLYVNYDTSLNGNVQVGGNLIVHGNLSALRIKNQTITNVTTNNYQLIVSEDISLNGRLFTSGDVSLNGNLTLANKGNLVIQNNSFARTISPNSANATAASWTTTVDGDTISWTSSSSSNFSTFDSYKAFDNNNGTSWASINTPANLYSVTGAYPGTGSANTLNINNSDVTSLSGEWLQIYTGGVPLILSSYQLGVLSRSQFPKTYYVFGSNDNTNWYGIHKGELTSQPSTDSSFNTTPITLTGTSYANYSGTGTLGITVSTTTAGNSYRYFRMAIPAIFATSGSAVAQLSEWKINFTTAATSSSTLSLDKLFQNQLNVSSGATFTGSVGIGTTNPTAALHVNGSFNIKQPQYRDLTMTLASTSSKFAIFTAVKFPFTVKFPLIVAFPLILASYPINKFPVVFMFPIISKSWVDDELFIHTFFATVRLFVVI